MKAAGTTLTPGARSSALVQSGPFRVSRNPMYLGALLAVVGECLLVGSVVSLFVFLLYFVALDRFVATREEPALQRQFGSLYQEYRRRVRRWL
jgi:protein-S-isoprenylcysteine O-methyltransferase Ste14